MRRLVVLVAVAGLVFAACSKRESPPAPGGAAPAPATVRIESARPQTVRDTIEAVGTVRSVRRSVLSSKLVAVVVGVAVHEGSRVTANEVVVTLDDHGARAQLARAEAGLREAEEALTDATHTVAAADAAVDAAKARRDLAVTTLDRYRTLHERRSVAPQEFDEVAARSKAAAAEVVAAELTRDALRAKIGQAAARIEQARAEVANAAVVVGYATIRAPSPGVVVSKTVEVGNLASPGTPLLVIEQERYRLEAEVGESAVRWVRLGDRAPVNLDSLGRTLEGRVSEVIPAADPASRTVTVKLDLAADPGLRSGLFGRARFPAGDRQALLLPKSALLVRGQLTQIYVVDERSVARLRLVTAGGRYGDRVEILSGLGPGERVVSEGAERVSDGGRVENAP